MPKAANPTEGGGTALETYDWAYSGTRGSPEEAGYVALKEPAAELDNDWNYAVREDLKLLNWEIGENASDISSLDSRLGSVESDLAALDAGYGSHTHDNRYYTKSQADDRYVDTTGDTMTGDLMTTGRVSVNSTASVGEFYVQGSNGIDSQTVVIDGDGDDGQHDDALLVRGGPDPATLSNSDSVLSVKGDGRVGINTYSPSADLDVVGESELNGPVSVGGELDMQDNSITNVWGTIQFSSPGGAGLDFTENSDGDHIMWRHTDAATNPTTYVGQLSSGLGTIWRIRQPAIDQDYLRLGTDGSFQILNGPLDAGDADWLTLPTYTGSDPNPPGGGAVRMWARPDLS